MRRRGRPVLGGISGLFFGLFVALDLFMFEVYASDSPLILALPVLGLIVGVALGLWAPLGRAPAEAAPPAG